MSDGEFQIPEGLQKLIDKGEDFFSRMAEESKKVIEKYGIPDELKTKKREDMTGIELITNERLEHKVKHGFSIRHDAETYKNNELAQAAAALILDDVNIMPNWDKDTIERMFSKPKEAKLVMAGALVAAQIDVENYRP